MFLVEQLRKSIAAGSKRAFQIAFRDAAPVEQQISDAAVQIAIPTMLQYVASHRRDRTRQRWSAPGGAP